MDFLMAGHMFPCGRKNPQKIDKDPKSEAMQCPVADIASLFLLKLNSMREKDLTDLVELAQKVGIPKTLKNQSLNEVQKENLQLVRLWIEKSTENDPSSEGF